MSGRRERRILLRSRIALSTACVVAIAIATISVFTWLITQHNLRAQLDETLLGRRPPAGAQGPAPDFTPLCAPGGGTQGLQRFVEGVQLLKQDGTGCMPPGVDPVVTEPTDLLVRTATLRDGQTASGASVRVLLQPLGHGDVLVVSRSLAEIDKTLTGLGKVLIVVSLFAAALAAVAGLLLTRRALAPMARLTRTAEEIARTEDLTLPVTVCGRDEVGRLGRAFTAMTAALSESRRRQRALVDDAAHELRTPLTSLLANIELLHRSKRSGRPLPEEQQARILDRLREQAGEFGDLVTELVVLARDDRELEREEVDLCDVIDRATDRARSRAGDHAIDAKCVPWRVLGDAGALERTVLNLLDNAMKFAPPSSTVTLRSEPGWLTVTDEGPGLAEEFRTSAFDRFWRAPDARALPGSGLGLAIVADSVAAHGGTARFVDPPDGRGACVRIELPALD